MTFDELVSEVMERLNLTSDAATVRVGKEINDRYRRLTSSIGLDTSRRVETSGTAVIGSRYLTFVGVEKILAVIDKTTSVDVPLIQVTFDEMHVTPIRSDPPRNYAVTRMGSTSCDIYMDSIAATAFTLWADAETTVITMQDTDEPEFPESFHDILVFGAMADEYRKMEKMPLMSDAESNYERRLSDLRMWIAKSAYLDIFQGKDTNRYPWLRGTWNR